jgi:hypothetical protein
VSLSNGIHFPVSPIVYIKIDVLITAFVTLMISSLSLLWLRSSLLLLLRLLLLLLLSHKRSPEEVKPLLVCSLHMLCGVGIRKTITTNSGGPKTRPPISFFSIRIESFP